MVWLMLRLASRFAAALIGVGLVAAPGQAQTPRVGPDFHARIWVAGFENPLEVRQSGLKRRIDIAEGGLVQTYITDRGHGSLTVMTAGGGERLAVVFPLPTEEVNSPLPLDRLVIERGAARLTRIGSSNIAGRSCQRYRYSEYLGRSGAICATRDGVVLELHPDGRRRPLFQVLSITPGRQEQGWFLPSPDYQIAVLPGVGGTVGRPPPPEPAAEPG